MEKGTVNRRQNLR